MQAVRLGASGCEVANIRGLRLPLTAMGAKGGNVMVIVSVMLMAFGVWLVWYSTKDKDTQAEVDAKQEEIKS